LSGIMKALIFFFPTFQYKYLLTDYYGRYRMCLQLSAKPIPNNQF
jgi:hypothetical protein